MKAISNLGAIVAIVFVASILVAVIYVSNPGGNNTPEMVTVFGFAGAAITGVLSYKASLDNAAALKADKAEIKEDLASVNKHVKGIDGKVAGIDDKVVDIGGIVKSSHDSWNSRLTEWKEAIRAENETARTLMQQETRQLVTEALAEGLRRGREEAAVENAAAIAAALSDKKEQ